MAGKNSKNPLLTGASISFPFENFTNSALLVPVAPQNEPTLLPEEIEADSFLGQEPPRSSSKPGRTPEHPPPPVFTQSFTGSTSPAKPTPIYADALNSQFNRTLTFQPPHSHNNDTLLYQNRETTTDLNLRQPPPIQTTTSLFYSNQNTFSTTPSIFTPVFTDSSPSEQSTLSTAADSVSPASQPIFNYFSSEQSHQNNKPPVELFSPSAPSPSATNSSAPPLSVINPSAPPSFINFSAPPTSVTNFSAPPPTVTHFSAPAPSITNFSAPPTSVTSFSAPPPTVTSFSAPTPSITNSSAPPSSNINSSTSLFLVSNSSTPSPSIVNPLAPPPSVTNTSAPSPSVTNNSASPFQPFPLGISSSTHPPTQTSEANATPPLGGAHNSYRLSNIKRPTYTRPPELSVTPMAAMPSPVAPPVAPAPASTTLFTPCSVDSTDSPVPTLFPSAPSVTPASSILPSSIPASNTTSAILPPSVPATIPTLPPSTSSPAPTILPSSPATVSVTAATASSYRPPQSQSPNAPSVLPPSFANLAQGTSYRPVYCHWFYKKIVEGKVLWFPFSMNDSLALEQAFTSPTISPDTKVPTDGGRYDVEVLRRCRRAVYWEEDPGEVRRCSWFVKGSMDVRFNPYEENVATMLEEEYRIAATSNEWNRHVSLPDGEMIVIHSPNAIAHHTRSASPDVWGNSPQMQQKPRVVKRGMDEFDISEGEPEKVDHLLFLVHGIGKFCDLKFRPVTEVVDDFRSVSLQLLQSHFKSAVEAGQAGRVEVLPVSWHQALHNADIDTRLNNITLKSIPRLRHFTNDTLLDILFYTSPVFCETIVQAVGNELNRLYNLFLSRNPTYQGGVSLGGHSLGSLILFDMLCNQVPVASPSPSEQPSTPTSESQEISGEEEVKTLGCMKAQKARLSRTVSYLTIGNAGTGQPFISYPQLVFKPKAFFALGSPIGMFVTVRGIESLGEDFALPTCPMFFNIFHPFDPVAYRIESLITSDFAKYSPVLIPHHKGRKRMHLELKDTLEHVGTALKQRLIESVRNTWNTVYQLTMFTRTDDQAIEQEVNKVLENEMMQSCGEAGRSETPDTCPEPDVKMGQLNGGRRIDYVLQEAPLESFNEYLFALSSHVCYWESEDTMLMMLKEIYGTMGITPDTQVVQQILPYEEPGHYSGGMDPTAPPSDSLSVGPPPVSGFIRGQK